MSKKTTDFCCVRSSCKNAKLIWMEKGQHRQTDNGYLVAKIGAWYCPVCAGSYGGSAPMLIRPEY